MSAELIKERRADPKDYVRMIQEQIPFALTRYNDGEICAVLGGTAHANRNCDGHGYLPEMCDDLRRTLVEPLTDERYYYGCGCGCNHAKWAQPWADWLDENAGIIDWRYSDDLQRMHFDGEARPLIEALRDVDVVMVGPARWLQRWPSWLFPYFGWVLTPEPNCYEAVGEIQRLIEQAVRMLPSRFCVVAFSASMATEVMMWRLWPRLSHLCAMIDFGSIWEPYCGFARRSVHSRLDWVGSLIEANTGHKPLEYAGGLQI